MLFMFLLLVILSLYVWLAYEPRRTSEQEQRFAMSAGSATVTNPKVIPDSTTSTPTTAQPLREDNPTPTAPVEEPQAESASIDSTASQNVTNEDSIEAEVNEPVLTEEEAIAQAVEATLARDLESSSVNGEGSVPELVHPNPPAPELVEAAIRDAEEKAVDFSPPEGVETEAAESQKKVH